MIMSKRGTNSKDKHSSFDFMSSPFSPIENVKEQSRNKYLRRNNKKKNNKSNKLDYWK